MEPNTDKNTLTIEELKALCGLFFEMGKSNSNFEKVFDDVMEGRYKAYIQDKSNRELVTQLQKNLYEEDEKLETERRINNVKAKAAVQELAKIILI